MTPETCQALNAASAAHRERTGHKPVWIGLNFLECMECGKHAHESGDPDRPLTLHHRSYTTCQQIRPDQF